LNSLAPCGAGYLRRGRSLAGELLDSLRSLVAASNKQRREVAALDLAHGVAGELVDEEPALGNLVLRQSREAVGAQFVFGDAGTRAELHRDDDALAEAFIWHADDRARLDVRKLVQDPFDLGRVHVPSAADDQQALAEG